MHIYIATLLLVTSFHAFQGFPVNWNNDDSRDYDVKVTYKNGSSSTFKSYHKSTRRGICSEPCQVEVIGLGSVWADYGETVNVKDGRLFKTK